MHSIWVGWLFKDVEKIKNYCKVYQHLHSLPEMNPFILS